MPTTSLPVEALHGFRWITQVPRVSRRAVSYYGRWPSPSQGRPILLSAKELLPLVGFLEACATLRLIQGFREQPGILTRSVSGKLIKYRPDFLFVSRGTSHLIFTTARAVTPFASLEKQLIARCGEDICHFRVCGFWPARASLVVLSALSPARLRRGLMSKTQRDVVRGLYRELVGGPGMPPHRASPECRSAVGDRIV